jgi:hypothetical protein
LIQRLGNAEMLVVVVSIVIGCGLGLFLNGRSRGSFFKKASGMAISMLGLLLFALMILVEAKKAGVV